MRGHVRVVDAGADRFNSQAAALALATTLVGACLPPAAIETHTEPALEPPTATDRGPDECRALVSTRGDRGPRVLELRWGPSGAIQREEHRGLIVGTADELFAIRVHREAFDPAELYDDSEGLSCERDVIHARRLPEGVEHPLIEARPACSGTSDRERVEVESSLTLISALGPLLSWRARVEGVDPSQVGLLAYRTLDLRDSEYATPERWLGEPSASMALPDADRLTCQQADVPRSLASTRGFALAWTRAGLRLRVGYDCCTWDLNHGMCEFDDPLPATHPELAPMLPDRDAVLHSPEGCGSFGLDGELRDRVGNVVTSHGVDPDELLGVVFLPLEHAFDAAWLEG